MGRPVEGATVTATGTVRTCGGATLHVVALHWRGSGTATGSIVLRDGGGSGTKRLTINTDALDRERVLALGDDYIEFETDIHATLANVDSLTLILG